MVPRHRLMLPRFLVNGVPSEGLPLCDRALHYGDGLFETLTVIETEPVLWEAHMGRLRHGCERLSIPLPDLGLLYDELKWLARGETRALAKVIVTRGCGGRGYRPPAQPNPTRILGLYPWPDYPADYWQQGVRLRICHTRLGNNPQLAGIKHLNRLENVLARAEWDAPEIFEGLLRNQQGTLVEGTMSNLFLVQGGRLITPDLSEAGVAGVIRQRLIDYAATESLPLTIGPVTERLLADADECFITNSVVGVLPVNAIDDTSYPVGPVTRRVQRAINPLLGR